MTDDTVKNARKNARSVVIALTAVAVSIGGAVCVAQASSQGAGSASFDAASIKAVPFDARTPIDFRFLPGRFVATNLTLGQLVEQAYGIEARELVGGPGWVRIDRFDVTFTVDGSVDRERMKGMLQSLLADRFQLELARDTQAGTVYTLEVDDVHDLKTAAPSERPSVSLAREDGNGFLSYRYEGRSATMAMLAQALAQRLRAPVLDQTNLTGSYDFSVKFAYDSTFGGLEPDPDVPTIFTALRNDLGLRLTAGKGAIPVYVIRRVEKPSPD